jgi:tRNA(fMet)-specific endonuclease VapC
MSGERCLLDTNAIVALLQGDVRLVQLLRQAEWIGISVISRIEFLAFSGLTEADRQQHRLKLPDAVIAAMAMQKGAALVTADREFAKAAALTVINWNDRNAVDH